MYDPVQMQRANRVAIASSLYMRKSSLDLRQSIEEQRTDIKQSRSNRGQSYGKIIKNNRKQINEEQKQGRQISNTIATHCTEEKQILTERINLNKYRNTPVLLHNQENIKIRAIEQKYANMLSEYQKKKDGISKEMGYLKQKNSNKRLIDSDPIKENYGTKQFWNSNTRKEKSQQSQKIFNKIWSNEHATCNSKQQPIVKKEDLGKQRNLDNFHQYSYRQKQFEAQEQKNQVLHEKISQKIRKNSQLMASFNLEKDNKQISTRMPKYAEKIIQKYSKFFKVLQTQITCDQKIRNLKQDIQNQSQTFRNDFQAIYEQQTGLTYENIAEEQLDPFYVSKQKTNKTNLKLYVEKFKEANETCQKNWKDKVLYSLSSQEAAEIFKCINFDNSKEISLKNFVRQISLYTGKSYRNRDLFRIYKRIQPFTEESFTQIFQKNYSQAN